MHHVGVDPVSDEKGSCVFYPTGEKSSTLGRKIEHLVRAASKTPKKPMSKASSRPRSEGGLSMKKTDVARPRVPLYNGRPMDEGTKSLILAVRRNEAKITGMVTTKT